MGRGMTPRVELIRRYRGCRTNPVGILKHARPAAHVRRPRVDLLFDQRIRRHREFKFGLLGRIFKPGLVKYIYRRGIRKTGIAEYKRLVCRNQIIQINRPVFAPDIRQIPRLQIAFRTTDRINFTIAVVVQPVEVAIRVAR